ncbi:26S proteasome complex ubiquitin receptor, subunit Rpn13 [Penicillium ucsense]|uniref:26S proteasome complex ubiquitin receptor, subunit Rpn13 n=1 Tax=Penicillium ucsense TaxID=2839758 RepID=A0A8J8W7F1_9EURO|nr:26S proteasome complex ubiquitin receptor, subunit Rpn13 [Penicillium ucsense]KAF7739187.1 26S proteasome complex ubiquitin receptor, subunit Rpn13 [Penicillium ucsense]
MSIAPLITFKAGICDFDSSSNPPTVKPKPTPGYIYLYSEDDLLHFCWRPRSALLDEPELDLVMIPSDGTFTPYPPAGKNTINGRVFVLKFSSSSQRYLFWMQSHPQHENGDPSWFSPRDLRVGEIVDVLLQGEDVDVQHEITNLPHGDDDETMEDVEGTDHDPNHNHGGGSGGAGPDATGGDIREEGEESREGGADGGRAAPSGNPSSVVQDFLRSLGGGQQGQAHSQDPERPSTTLQDLLTPSSTLPFIETANDSTVNHLLSFLPPALLLLAQGNAEAVEAETDPDLAQAALLSLDHSQKKDILRRVLRSPQFMQSLASLTVALRDGGLPSISEALQIPVANGGFMRRGGVPLGGGDAVEAFVEGVRQQVKEKDQSGQMETD